MIRGHTYIHHRANKQGTRFVMSFGFVRSKYVVKAEYGTIIISKGNFNSYLQIMDEYSRDMWVFPTISKSPHIAIVNQFLDKYGLKD